MAISEPLQMNLYFVLYSKNDIRNRAVAGGPKIAAKLPEFLGLLITSVRGPQVMIH